MKFRVGPPQLSAGKVFWPVEEAKYNMVKRWMAEPAKSEFSHWEVVSFHESEVDAKKASKRLNSNEQL